MSENEKTTAFLADLKKQGITLWAEGENLRFNAPKNGLPPHLRTEIVARKAELLAFLQPTITDDVVIAEEAEFVAPRTPQETAVSQIWQRILSLETTSIYDNFFAQGGDSILATQIISWIRQTYEVNVPVRVLFENPTIAGLAGHIEAAHQLEGSSLQINPLPATAKEEGVVLSFAQQRSWFLDQLTPENPFYNMPKTLHLIGELNVPVLTQTLNEIMRRHETLRTQFIAVDGQPRTFVKPHSSLEIATVTVQDYPIDERMDAAYDLLSAEVQRPFNLTEGALIRPFLVQLSRQEHILLLTMHHIASDGWSTGVLLREIAALYPAFLHGKPSPLPELTIQYADFATWQRQWLQTERLQQHLTYWQKQLHNLPTLSLPTDHPRPPIQTVVGTRTLFKLPPTLTQTIDQLSQQEGVTLFMSLLATFQTLLSRYANQEDIVVGSPIANRTHTKIENLIGFFANMLVLRTDFSGNPTFRELLQQVRETALAAYEHQDLPFEKLVEELQPERDLSRSPLFQAVFALQNAPMPAFELPNLTLKSLPLDKGTSAYDINMAMWRRDGQLEGRIEYNTDLFDGATITCFIDHFQQLLTQLMAHPDTPIAQLSFLTEAEKAQLTNWNKTEAEYPQTERLTELFEQQVAQTETAVAVTYADQKLTYAELNQRANQLAHYLQSLNVGPETFVGLCVERSPEMMVGLLGILKAGAAYVPLDPGFPQERLAYMVQDAELSIILTQQTLIDIGQLPFANCQQIPLDSAQDILAQFPKSNPSTTATTDNLAYVIYTSGSTGTPKGVQIPHRPVVNFLKTMRQQPGLSAADTLLSVTTLSFDIAVLELFLPLTVGATVALVSREVAADGVQLMQAMRDAQATVMQATPATWRLLLTAGWEGDNSLKILCGGEALPAALANELIAKGNAVWNLYGPTETTIWSVRYQVASNLSQVPIGRPIANTQIYLLDKHYQPVPIGVTGEIYIAGDGLARGYRKRPSLTADRFIPNPFSTQPGQRMYKTGDVGRYLPDGNIEYLGRNDHQVKVRGFRIELGEIESQLNQHPTINNAIVTTQQDSSDSSFLVGYFITEKPEASPTGNDLREHLIQTLPDYMIPNAFIQLDAFPLTPNGKIDRKALPAPGRKQLQSEKGVVPPRNEFEEILAEVWEEVLPIDPIGIYDNFFNLGGHSLLATQVVSRIRDRFEIELPVRTLFEAPTIAELSLRVEQILIAEIEALDEAETNELLAEETS